MCARACTHVRDGVLMTVRGAGREKMARKQVVVGPTYSEQPGERGSREARSIYSGATSGRGDAAAPPAGAPTHLFGKVNLTAFWMKP